MIWLIISIIIIAADQIVKYLVMSGAQVGETIASLGLFNITYVQNRGAAFSMLSGHLSVLSVISLVFCAAVAVYWVRKKPSHPLLCVSLTLLFSGALANAFDRLFRGFVVDYIQTTFINFPVFNIADMAITIGAALVVLYEAVFDREEKKEK